MAAGFVPKNRNVIPRWRDFATTLELGELSQPSSQRTPVSLKVDLLDLENDWQTERTLSFAADLISAAVLSGGSDVAREAANYVLELGVGIAGEPLTRLALNIVKPAAIGGMRASVIEARGHEQISKSIGDSRQRLHLSPRNAILWVDLSLLYAIQGLAEKAERAMVVALGLEPDNRFVLRSAARLYIHRGEPDVAHRLLRRSNAIKVDPWIMSAELATASSAKFITFSIDSALKLLGDEKFAPSQTTELSAAIATIELIEGNTTKAKRHLRRGLRSPNENSLAQVRWLQRDLRGFLPELSVTDVERSFEASLWESYAKQEWSNAAAFAVRWFKDQPFSSRPAFIGANITAGLLEDYRSAISLAKLGLIANPGDHLLISTLAFSYASNGQLKEARDALAQLKGPIPNNTEVTAIANYGLIAFREGEIEAGRTFYEAAQKTASAKDAPELTAGALVYWAREEILAKTDKWQAVLSRAREATKDLNEKHTEVRAALKSIEEKAERLAK